VSSVPVSDFLIIDRTDTFNFAQDRIVLNQICPLPRFILYFTLMSSDDLYREVCHMPTARSRAILRRLKRCPIAFVVPAATVMSRPIMRQRRHDRLGASELPLAAAVGGTFARIGGSSQRKLACAQFPQGQVVDPFRKI